MGRFLLTLLLCLLLTLLLETGLALILGMREKKDLLNEVLANVLTNPVAVTLTELAAAFLPRGGYIAAVAAAELAAFLTEGFLYRRYLVFRRVPPYLLSLILNTFSFGIGLLADALFF